MKAFKFLLIASAVVVMTGCKIAVVVVEGGNVESPVGTTFCSEGSNCLIEITDASFSQTFTAVPKLGYEFVKWRSGAGFLCGDSTNPTCTFTMPANADVAAAVIGEFETGHIMPIFKDVGIDADGDGVRDELDEDDDNDGLLDVDDPCPLNPDLGCGGDIITVNGKVWYQSDLFIGVTAGEIAEVCGSGVCDGVVNGYTLTGWAWASDDDLDALMAHYGTMNLEQECNQVYSFFADGWRKTQSSIFVSGVTIAFAMGGYTSSGDWYGILDPDIYDGCSFSTVGEAASYPPTNVGAFFYYPPGP